MRKKIGFSQFRSNLDQIFNSMSRCDSVAYQLVDLTDLFQKVAAIYDFAKKRKDTAFQNPIIFQIVQSALYYGVCVSIRRLADGKQKNEISLFKLAAEIRSNCESWSRSDFVTWDAKPYHSSKLREEHKAEAERIISEMTNRGERATWLPIGAHEEIERRHNIFDFLSGVAPTQRSKDDVWAQIVPTYLLQMLEKSTADVVHFANVYLAHRVDPSVHRKPEFDISLSAIEDSISCLWKCFNVLNSIFYDSYMTPDIIHSLGSFNNLDIPLATEKDFPVFIKAYETTKERMEAAVNNHSRNWRAEIVANREAAE